MAAERARGRPIRRWPRACVAVKRLQHARFEAHLCRPAGQPALLRSAAQFFLDDLYGPERLHAPRRAVRARRARDWCACSRTRSCGTVMALGELHALVRAVRYRDGRGHARARPSTTASYADAWRTVGRPAERDTTDRADAGSGSARSTATRASPCCAPACALMRGPAARCRAGGAAGLPGTRLRHLPRHGRGARVPGDGDRAREQALAGPPVRGRARR
ncbi:MAG: hypothetical protein MZW92_55765 [Comamonadaceae bacterium]|nr:hypothetical protein [Comamonadaceae bacterium]